MENSSEIALPLLMAVAAVLYASVGHAGASGYLAAMALFGVAPAEMKPAALVLNVLVASIASFKYVRAGHFSWPLFWPLALFSIPAAYLGGRWQLPVHYYRPLVGLVLVYAAWRLLLKPPSAATVLRQPALSILFVTGAAIGLLSGLTGVGGGIFLSPILLFAAWAGVRQASGIAAPFILVNSLAGLLGLLSVSPQLPSALPVWAVAAIAGGYVGAEYGSRRLPNPVILKLLAIVLLVAGIKMLLI